MHFTIFELNVRKHNAIRKGVIIYTKDIENKMHLCLCTFEILI